MSQTPHEEEQQALYRLVELQSSNLLAKVRAILLRPPIKEEIFAYLEAEIERMVAGDPSLEWMKGAQVVMDEERTPNQYPGRMAALPTIWINMTMPTGFTLQGKLTLTTTEGR